MERTLSHVHFLLGTNLSVEIKRRIRIPGMTDMIAFLCVFSFRHLFASFGLICLSIYQSLPTHSLCFFHQNLILPHVRLGRGKPMLPHLAQRKRSLPTLNSLFVFGMASLGGSISFPNMYMGRFADEGPSILYLIGRWEILGVGNEDSFCLGPLPSSP